MCFNRNSLCSQCLVLLLFSEQVGMGYAVRELRYCVSFEYKNVFTLLKIQKIRKNKNVSFRDNNMTLHHEQIVSSQAKTCGFNCASFISYVNTGNSLAEKEIVKSSCGAFHVRFLYPLPTTKAQPKCLKTSLSCIQINFLEGTKAAYFL